MSRPELLGRTEQAFLLNEPNQAKLCSLTGLTESSRTSSYPPLAMGMGVRPVRPAQQAAHGKVSDRRSSKRGHGARERRALRRASDRGCNRANLVRGVGDRIPWTAKSNGISSRGPAHGQALPSAPGIQSGMSRLVPKRKGARNRR